MPRFGRYTPEERHAACLAACRRAIDQGRGLATEILRPLGAVGADAEIKRIRDSLIESGEIVPAATRGHAPWRTPKGAAAAPADPGSPAADGGRVRDRSPSEYVAGLKADIAAAEAEFVERGELPGPGEWHAAVLRQTDLRRHGSRGWARPAV